MKQKVIKVLSHPTPKIKKSTNVDALYREIDANFLTHESSINFDIYTKDGLTYVIFYPNGSVLDEAHIVEAKLKSDFFVLSDDIRAFNDYVNENIKNILDNKNIPIEERSKAVYKVSTNIVGNMFKDPYSPENLKRSEDVVNGIIDIVLSNENALLSLMKVTEHDYRTHTHCINVSIYAINIGQSLDFTAEELCELGTAAMLHDLGKTQVDAMIINKNGKLTLEEFDKMKTHPEEGYLIAKELGINNERILEGIRNHHEKFDGTGYPQSLKSDNISIYSQIIAICDIFDALTTERPYKKAFSTFDALKLMKDEFSEHISMKILTHFIRHLYAIAHEK